VRVPTDFFKALLVQIEDDIKTTPAHHDDTRRLQEELTYWKEVEAIMSSTTLSVSYDRRKLRSSDIYYVHPNLSQHLKPLPRDSSEDEENVEDN
jgi:hypothetical protein